MTFLEFKTLVEKLKVEHPHWFESECEPPATDGRIHEVETRLRITFPDDYRLFLKTFGGGYFAFTNIFSVNPSSEWNIVTKNSESGIPRFLAVSDDEAGGYYGYRVDNIVTDRRIYYWDHESQKVLGPQYDDIFSYIANTGFQSQINESGKH